ncbi:putative sushi, von Willebrand factor type A [Apostichopus japonicus]|uniref:Putative sushi, von Willebrand factor type A n=1 Tax=Stichopus japonicus TaxID=307972 RepID=A0A2G8LMU1_STIJA|nr:putative sushi, von Willebrand factor type A [Apostichopus japonicus]
MVQVSSVYLLSALTIVNWGYSLGICQSGECAADYFVPEISLLPDKDCYSDGDSVDLTCDGHFGGPSTNQCIGGSWTLPTSTCEVFICQRPMGDPALMLSPNESTYTARDLVTYSCMEGYILIGTDQATCDQPGEWNPSTVPDCLVACPTPNVSNGTLSFPGPYQEGDTVIVTCDDGFSRGFGLGSPPITCTEDGWDSEPVCYADCLVPAVDNSDHMSDRELTHEETIEIHCNDGYSYNQGHDFQVQCNDSVITSGTPDVCHLDCDPLSHPINGEVSGNYLHGTTAFYTCDFNSKLNGSTEATCEDGVWSNGAGVYKCYEFTCTVPEISDEELSLEPNKSVYNGSEVIEYSCPDDMMLVGKSNSTCVDQDLWDMTPPTCESVQVSTCTAPTVTDDGLRFEPSKDSYSIGETITYSCDGDLELKGTVSATCEDENQWNPPSLPICSSGHVHRVAILLMSVSVFLPKYFA